MKRSSARQNFLHFTILRCLVSFDFKLRRKVWDDKVEKLKVNSIFYKYKTAIHDPDLGFDLGQQTKLWISAYNFTSFSQEVVTSEDFKENTSNCRVS